MLEWLVWSAENDVIIPAFFYEKKCENRIALRLRSGHFMHPMHPIAPNQGFVQLWKWHSWQFTKGVMIWAICPKSNHVWRYKTGVTTTYEMNWVISIPNKFQKSEIAVICNHQMAWIGTTRLKIESILETYLVSVYKDSRIQGFKEFYSRKYIQLYT